MKSGFVHLHVHSEYSLLDGACRIKDLVPACKELGMDAIALTDHGVMYGTIDFYDECKKSGIKPIIGCEVYTAKRSRFNKDSKNDSDYGHLILLAENNEGYSNLIKLVSVAFTEGYYYKPRVDRELLKKYSKGLICLSACLGGDIPAHVLNNEYTEAKELALWFNEVFGQGNFFLELQHNGIEEQFKVNKELIRISQETGIPLICTNDVHFINKEDARTQEILICIQTGKRINDPDRMMFNTDTVYLRSPEEMYSLFQNVPEALENTLKVAERCNVEIQFGRPVLPNFEKPFGLTSDEYIRKLCLDGAKKRYGEISDIVSDRLEYELSVIKNMGYSDYYLIVWDFIKYAKDHGITVGPGRGSGAGSLVAYCLGITNIDSLKYKLAFERFLNPERISMPDFDVDFCDERRKEVIDYVVSKYGEDRVAQITTFGTMAARGSVRDVGRVLDIPYAYVDEIAKLIPFRIGMTIEQALGISSELKSRYDSDPTIKDLLDTAMKLEGMPRNISTHAAGVVLTKNPVTDYVPVQKTQDSVVTQFPMTTLEKLGLLKVDFLGLRTLTVINESTELIKKQFNIDVDFDNMVMNDPNVFKTICDGKTAGIFQLESPGMTRFMIELQPDNLEDIIAGIALYRPGPMDQIPKYISNKRNPDNIKYDHPILEHILDVTYGCMVYQEQVMQIVRDMAGYTMGQSDLVRRAMAKKKHDVMEKERINFVNGALTKNVDVSVANKVFDQMIDFASYAFNKAHAACYAVVGYQTAWLKTYYPVIFMASLLNSYMGSPDKITQYIGELRLMNIPVLPPDINSSNAKFTVVGDSIQFGLMAIKNVGINAVENIIEERNKNGKFDSLQDFLMRTGPEVNKRCVESFIKAGVFDSLGIYRSKLLAVFETAMDTASNVKKRTVEGQLSLFGLFDEFEDSDQIDIDYPDIPEFPQDKLLSMEKEMMGMYISGHPLFEYESKLSLIRNIKSSDLTVSEDEESGHESSYSDNVKDNMKVVTGGIITDIKKKTTKNNAVMAFVTIEDMYGKLELLMFPKVLEQYNSITREEAIIIVEGRLSLREDENPNIIVEAVSPIDIYFNANAKTINYRIDSGKLKKAEAFIRYFEGKTEINLYDDKEGKLLFKGFINADNSIILYLEEILKS